MTGGAGPQRDENDRVRPVQKQRRQISIGYIPPTELKGRIIYVQLRKIEGMSDDYAEAISAKGFNHIDYSRESNPCIRGSTSITNRVGSMNGYYNISPDVFLSMLQEENDAVISEDRRNKDGLELTRRIGILEGLGPFKTQSSLMASRYPR